MMWILALSVYNPQEYICIGVDHIASRMGGTDGIHLPNDDEQLNPPQNACLTSNIWECQAEYGVHLLTFTCSGSAGSSRPDVVFGMQDPGTIDEEMQLAQVGRIAWQ